MRRNRKSRSPSRQTLIWPSSPDCAEIRTNLGETGGLAEDLFHYELLSHLLPPSFWGHWPADSSRSLVGSNSRAMLLPPPFDFGSGLGWPDTEPGSDQIIAEVDREDLVDRTDLANRIRQAGEPALAEVELEKSSYSNLMISEARMTRAMQSIEAERLDLAFSDIKSVIDDPGLPEYVRNESVLIARYGLPNSRSLIGILGIMSRKYCYYGRIEEGGTIARRVLDLAIAFDNEIAESHFDMAYAYVSSSQVSLTDVLAAADHLAPIAKDPSYKLQYESESTFDAVRTRIDAVRDGHTDRGDHGRRRLAELPPRKAASTNR